jgi:hypothetical protein
MGTFWAEESKAEGVKSFIYGIQLAGGTGEEVCLA